MNQKTIRWKQRFENYRKAYQKLDSAVSQENLNELERSGLVQTFEFTFELAWKTLKDYLESEGIEAQSPRETIKKSFQASYITDGAMWVDALEKRNLLAHSYSEELSLKACDCTSSEHLGLNKPFCS